MSLVPTIALDELEFPNEMIFDNISPKYGAPGGPSGHHN